MKSKYKDIILDSAYNDIDEIVKYFRTYSKKGAERISSKIHTAISRIKTHPYIGPAVFDEKLAAEGLRMVVIEKYLMFYKVFDDKKSVVIYRVIDGRRNYPYLLGNLPESQPPKS